MTDAGSDLLSFATVNEAMQALGARTLDKTDPWDAIVLAEAELLT